MNTRKATLLALLTAFLSNLVAAQVDTGPSVVELIQNIIGIDAADPLNAVGLLATLGIMTGLVYVLLKIVLDRAGILKYVYPGIERGVGPSRNILLILSALITVSGVAGAGGMGIVQGYQSLFVLLMAIGLLAGLAVVLLGGGGGAIGLSILGAGAGASAAAEGATALGNLWNKSKQRRAELKDAKENIKNEPETATEEIQDVLEKIEKIDEISSRHLNNDKEELEDAIKNVRETIELKGDEMTALVSLQDRVTRASNYLYPIKDQYHEHKWNHPRARDEEVTESYTFMTGERNYNGLVDITGGRDIGLTEGIEGMAFSEKIENVKLTGEEAKELSRNLPGSYNANDPAFQPYLSSTSTYGLLAVDEDLMKARKQIEIITEDLSAEETDEKKAFNELLNASENLFKIVKLMKEVHEELDQAEKEDQMLEKVAENKNWKQVYQKAEKEEKEEEELEKQLEAISNKEQELQTELETAHKLLQKHLKEDEEMVNQLKSTLGKIDKEPIDNVINELKKYFQPQKVDGTPILEGSVPDKLQNIKKRYQGIEHNLDKIEDEERMEAKRERKVMSKLEEHFEEA